MATPKQLLEITIHPPFYKTWWFRLLVLLTLALIGFALFRYRIAQIEEKAALNTRIAENKMEALRSQMNPHFIFNSLQTVVAFITRKDDRGAIDYINQFAKLMRTVIENSRDGMISLEREIELLELYMKIEARRLKHPFTYTFNVGSEVDTYDTEIPSMLLQPFVENAIKHGLFHKKEKGHLTIGFLSEDKGLKCYVEDNGIGRNKSKELNQQMGRTHTSRGLQIVEERIEIIKKTNPGKYSFQIIDLFDQEQKPAGTRAEILLPFQV